jgi:hypothetical protein
MNIFEERGIDPELRDARGYARWERGDLDAILDTDPGFRVVEPPQLSAVRYFIGQQPAWVIRRHHDPVIFTTRVWRDAAEGSPGYWGFSGCAGCSISICAERRRMTIKQFMATVPIEFGGTKPVEKEPER